MSPTDRLARMIAEARSVAAFTGAGMSTESGIPDYRSPGGVWERFQPPMLPEFVASEEARRRYWRFYQEFFPAFLRARPNPGHLALGRLHAAGRLAGVATQNIDGLHAAGGVPAQAVWELHGNVFAAGCLSCGGSGGDTARLLEEFAATSRPPACGRCGGPVKPRTISFGQGLDAAVLEGAARLCREAELLLVMGSSLAVAPASQLPALTLEAGGRLAILNRTPTHLDGRAELIVREPAGAALAAAVERALGA